MDVNIEQNGTVESSEESMVPSYSYVLHGAQAYCESGSRPGRITIPKCHGTYLHDMPIMTIEDSEAQVNIKAFGFCMAMDNPDRLAKVREVMDKVEEDQNLLDKMMNGLSGIKKAVESVFGFGEDKSKDPYHGYSPDVFENVTVPCRPKFAIGDVWQEGSDRLKINGVNALTSKCWIHCVKSEEKGKIQLVDDGQDNATSEQRGAADMASWKKGDPIPEANQGNLERLEENIAELEEQLKTANTGEYHRLKAEIDSKIELRDQMSSTLSMVNEIKTGLMYGAYEDYDSAIKDMNTIQEAFQNGTPCVTVSDKEQNELLNGAYQTHSDGGDVAAYLDENASSIPYSNFNGTAVNEENANDVGYIYSNGKLMTRAEYNQFMADYVVELANAENG